MTNLRTINNHDIESVNEMARRHGGRHNNNNDQKDDLWLFCRSSCGRAISLTLSMSS